MNKVVAVYDYPDAVRAFVENGLWQGTRQFGKCTSVGFANENEGLVAGFVFHNYDPDTNVIEVSGYSARRDWCTLPLFKALFEYPFDDLGVRLVAARHSEHNRRARRIWRAIGANEYTIPELRAEGEAEVISILTKDAWLNSKFMRHQNGKT